VHDGIAAAEKEISGSPLEELDVVVAEPILGPLAESLLEVLVVEHPAIEPKGSALFRRRAILESVSDEPEAVVEPM